MDKRNLRYNILTVLVYIIGIILIIQLFNLQIVHGEEYREKSSTRLTRETKIEAARGNILDRNGNPVDITPSKASGWFNQTREVDLAIKDKVSNDSTLIERCKNWFEQSDWFG